jgi:hypothetical protein
MTIDESVAYFLHVYPSYTLASILSEYFCSFKYLLEKKQKFIANDRLEDIQVALSPHLKKEQLNRIIQKYESVVNKENVVNSDTIERDREKLKKLLKK